MKEFLFRLEWKIKAFLCRNRFKNHKFNHGICQICFKYDESIWPTN